MSLHFFHASSAWRHNKALNSTEWTQVLDACLPWWAVLYTVVAFSVLLTWLHLYVKGLSNRCQHLLTGMAVSLSDTNVDPIFVHTEAVCMWLESDKSQALCYFVWGSSLKISRSAIWKLMSCLEYLEVVSYRGSDYALLTNPPWHSCR